MDDRYIHCSVVPQLHPSWDALNNLCQCDLEHLKSWETLKKKAGRTLEKLKADTDVGGPKLLTAELLCAESVFKFAHL